MKSRALSLYPKSPCAQLVDILPRKYLYRDYCKVEVFGHMDPDPEGIPGLQTSWLSLSGSRIKSFGRSGVAPNPDSAGVWSCGLRFTAEEAEA